MSASGFRTGQIIGKDAIKCPRCGAGADGFGGSGEPDPGDVAVCGYCAGINRYGPGLTIEVFPDEELAALDADERRALERAQAQVRAMIQQRRPR